MNRSNPHNRPKNFQEFWPYYVREHSHQINRILHFIGSTLVIVCLASAVIIGKWSYVLLSLIVGYGFAWFGHFFIERNKPATFEYPLWSLRADWKMWALMLTGQMEPEVRRADEGT